MLKQRLTELLMQAALEAQKQGKLPAVTLPEVALEHPQNTEHGDYASSLPLKLARATRANPIAIANEIVALIPPTPEVGRINVAPPGFINLFLSPEWLARQVDAILQVQDSFGDNNLGKGSRIQIEFVSVNPTGPLHVGHGRGAVLGSTLANVLARAGYRVEKEYYINDAGNQIQAFSISLWARYQQALGKTAEMPTEGYQGNYLVELAQEVVREEGDRFLRMPEPDAVRELGGLGVARMLGQIKADLERLGVTFDVWFSEQSLFDRGQFATVMSFLRERGFTTEREGATWFATSALGESKDNVLVRGDGTPTYFASDIAYHYNKFLERQFQRVINIWGADHQGHVSRMKAAVSALGVAPERLHIIISQLVTLRRGEEIVRLSKRSGDIITLKELMEEVGPDVCRFFFLSRAADSQMDFDLELAKKQSEDNPVYYVQYAHARIASILRLAEERGIKYDNGDVSVLTTGPELALIRKMLLLPELLEMVTTTLEPHHLTYYALELATVFHLFYKDCRVVSSDECLTQARLKLAEAAKLVLAKTLRLMGMTAPDRM